MSDIKTKRKKMEKLIYDFFSSLDPTGTNTNYYKGYFGKMSDKEFANYFNKFVKDTREYLTLTVAHYEYDLTMENITKTAKMMGVPLFEYVMMPHINHDKNNPVTTPERVPVGYIHMKRPQQMLRKKNSTSIHIDKRDAITGQVTSEDKNARVSIDEVFCLMTYGAKEAAHEFLSARADDLVMKEEMYSKIRKDGFVSMRDLDDKLENKTSLNTLEMYLTCMGLKSDLISTSEVLPTTIDEL